MFRALIGVVIAAGFASVVSAATFPVSNPAEFQTALTTAQSNGENDIIDVAECSGAGCSLVMGSNVYDITSPLTYTAVAAEGFSLTIDGFDSDTRILRGIGVPILRIDTTGATEDFGANIAVKGMTLAQGNNTSTPNNGGALYILVNNPGVEVSGSVFDGNAADGHGGALFIRAQGVGELPIDIFDVTFDTNSAGGDGGAAYVAASENHFINISNIDFFDNDAANGGGLHIEGLDPTDAAFERAGTVQLFDIDFSDNIARTGNGGGANIAARFFEVNVTGFVTNLASNGSGGGLYFHRNFNNFTMINTGLVRNVAGVDGGGFATEAVSFALVTNNTLYGNSAGGSGGGALVTVGGSTGQAAVYNNIIYANEDAASGLDIFIDNDPFLDIPAAVEFFNNDITDLTGFPDASTNFGITSSAELTSGDNIDAAPVLPLILDIDPDPSQGAMSPTIDAGLNTATGVPNVDFEGDFRPIDGDGDMAAVIDIGMDEFLGGGALPAVDLSVTKTDSPDPVTGGENVTYSITVTNAGPDAATGVTLTDTIDATATFVSAIFNQGTPCTTAGTPVVITCMLGNIASGNSVAGTIVITSPSVTVVSGIANSVTVSANEADDDSTNNTAQQGTTVVPPAGPPMADLSVTKMDTPDPVFSGGPDLTYTITVDNNGPDPATGVTLADTLPAGVTFQSASASVGQCDVMPIGGVLTCGLGDLADGSNATVTIVVAPDVVTAETTITNSATVTAVEQDPTLTNNTVAEDTTVNPPSADMSVATSSTPDSPLINEQITYNLTVSNAGPSDNMGTVLTVALPAMTTFVSASVEQGSCVEASGVLTCSIGDLASGAAVNAQIIVTAPGEAMTLTLSATITADFTDPTPADNTISADVIVIDVIDLIIQGTSKGTGSFGWIELLLLLTLVGATTARARRRQLRYSPRALLPALVAAMSIMALTVADDVQAEDDWYVGISAGRTNLDYDAGDLTNDLAGRGWTINNPSVDDSNDTWKLYAGFRLNDWFAIEAGYVDLGEVVTQFGATIPPTQINALLSDTLSVHPYQGDGWIAGGVARYELVPDQLFVMGRAGLFAWKSKTVVRVIQGGTGSVAGEDSGTDAMFGVGLEWQLNDRWSLTADWERYKLNEWLDVPSIGVKVSF